MKKSVKILCIFTLILSICLSSLTINAKAEENYEIYVTAKGAVIMDFDTGIVLWGHNEDEMLVPASMIKMVAVHVIYDAIRDGKVTLDTTVTVSSEISTFSRDREFANVPLSTERTYTVKQLLDYVIIRSAGAATLALAEGVFGSEQELIRLMNEKAVDIGVEAEFHDSWGFSSENKITATGMAIMTRALLMEYPEVLDVASQMFLTIGNTEFRNSNLLLGEYDGVDGLKTGFTNAAGRCLVATAYRDGRRIITVIMGATTPRRYPETRRMLDFGFARADEIVSEYLETYAMDSIDLSDKYWSIPFVLGQFDHILYGTLSEQEKNYGHQSRTRFCLLVPVASPFFVIG